MNVKKTQGFTLIELMIVVAIVAILAAIALPAYQNYIKRSKVTEGLVALDACKASVSEFVASQNALPADIDQAGCSNYVDTQYTTNLDYNAGAVSIEYRNVGDGVNGETVTLTPDTSSVANGQIVAWSCSGTVRPELLPASCRGAST